MTHIPPPPTDEQLDILSTASSATNLMISALAGCGKTDTLERILAEQSSPALYLAFNKRNAEEAKLRLPPNVQCRTLNGLGYRVWAEQCPHRLTLDDFKDRKWLQNEIKTGNYDAEDRRRLWAAYPEILDAVKRAKVIGYIPFDHRLSSRRVADAGHLYDDTFDHLSMTVVDRCLLASIKTGHLGTIDFADQIYLPTLFGGRWPTFPLTTVDEYQDLNPLNHLMISRLCAKGRLIGVGDPNQNIYQFRGAHASGMTSAIREHSMEVLPLTTSFRCPSAIVQNVWWHVPEFRAFRRGGHVLSPDFFSLLDFREDSVILCRNNAPLLALALRLLSAGRPINLAGSDISGRLLTTLRKLGDPNLTRRGMFSAIEDFRAKSSLSSDLADCMMVFASTADNLAQAIAYAEHIFAQRGTILLSTGHKAKGLEWSMVYHLDEFLCAGPEDANLRYVIQTRSSDTYIEVYSDRIRD